MYSFKEASEIINKALFNQNFLSEPKELYQPIEYILAAGGKRLRPALVIMACNLFSENIEKAIKPAIGIEIFHNFTLLHDDIMDNADLRRNQKTVHKKWNDNVAILSGDAMAIKASHYISECDTSVLKEILNIYNKTAIEVCEGQQYDMNFENRQMVSVDEYLKMIELKTSVLIAASLQIGAIIGGAEKKDAHLLYDFGKNIGLSFQLQDDLLDVYGDPKIFGKNIGGDIVSNKKTFLLIKAFELASNNDLSDLKKYMGSKDFDPEEKIDAVKSIYNKLEINKIAEDKQNEYYKKSLNLLQEVNVKENKKEYLKELVEEIIKRTK